MITTVTLIYMMMGVEKQKVLEDLPHCYVAACRLTFAERANSRCEDKAVIVHYKEFRHLCVDNDQPQAIEEPAAKPVDLMPQIFQHNI